MNKYEIDPAKATMKKFDGKYDQVHAINDTCFGICTAYGKTFNVSDLNNKCTQSCENLMQTVRQKKFGVGKCDHQGPDNPVIWDNQTPHFFPSLLVQGMSPKNALEKCYDKARHISQECLDNCETDYYALVMSKHVVKLSAEPSPPSPKKSKKSRTLEIIVIVGVISIVLVFLALFLLMKKYPKKK